MTSKKLPTLSIEVAQNILQEKLKILTPLLKVPKNVGDSCKLIVAKGFEKLPKVIPISQSGHTKEE